MANNLGSWTEHTDKTLQVFKGGYDRNVFVESLAKSGSGCCSPARKIEVDKLPSRLNWERGNFHTTPNGGTYHYVFPHNMIEDRSDEIINHINHIGVGARIGIIAIPTYAWVTGIHIKVIDVEPGLSFNLITRNGLTLPQDVLMEIHQKRDNSEHCKWINEVVNRQDRPSVKVSVSSKLNEGSSNTITNNVTVSSDPAVNTTSIPLFSNFGGSKPDGVDAIDLIGRSARGEFALYSDELQLEVASMPAETDVVGLFNIEVSAQIEVITRAAQISTSNLFLKG